MVVEEVSERSREKERSKDKEKDRLKKDKDAARDKDRDREKEKSKDRDKDKDRDKGRDKDKARDRDKDTEKKEKAKEPEKDKDRGRGKDRKEREKGRNDMDETRDKDESRSSRRAAEAEGVADDKDKDGTAGSSKDLAERIAQARAERTKGLMPPPPSARKTTLPPAPVLPKTLGEAADTDDLSSWLQNQRQAEVRVKMEEKLKARAKAEAERLSRRFEEEEDFEDYDLDRSGPAELAGLKVRHGLEKVMEGGAIVLTLKDSNILDEKGNDINAAADELENIEIMEQKKRDDARKAAKKGPGTWSDKFHDDVDDPKRSILAKYDEMEEDGGVTLDAQGGFDPESQRRLEEVQRRLKGAFAADAKKQSLAGNGLTVGNDYMTSEEMLQFNKPKKLKKKKLRKREVLNLDAMEAEAKAAGLGGASDLGSRAKGGAKESKDLQRRQEENAAREAGYSRAKAKAAEASKALLENGEEKPAEDGAKPQEEEKRAQPLPKQEEEVKTELEEEEDDELQRALERARKLALQTCSKAAAKGVEAIASRVKELKQEEDAKPAEDAGLVFTDTGEFVRGLGVDEAPSTLKQGEATPMEEDKPEEDNPPSPSSPAAAPGGGGWTEISTEEEPKAKEDAKEKPEEDGGGVQGITDEASVGAGLAGALKLLQQRGALSESVEWGGRNMDKKKGKLVGVMDELPESEKRGDEKWKGREVRLERFDEFGRLMTPKEAFRQLSHKFHGKGPGKMKQEKRLKQWREELKLKQMNAGDTPLQSVEKMREVQASMSTPYLVLSGNIKPGQTSDPRSAFATVEKEVLKPGDLTPMLGEQKVEKFLGIKRKDPGSMGPPAAKKVKM